MEGTPLMSKVSLSYLKQLKSFDQKQFVIDLVDDTISLLGHARLIGDVRGVEFLELSPFNFDGKDAGFVCIVVDNLLPYLESFKGSFNSPLYQDEPPLVGDDKRFVLAGYELNRVFNFSYVRNNQCVFKLLVSIKDDKFFIVNLYINGYSIFDRSLTMLLNKHPHLADTFW